MHRWNKMDDSEEMMEGWLIYLIRQESVPAGCHSSENTFGFFTDNSTQNINYRSLALEEAHVAPGPYGSHSIFLKLCQHQMALPLNKFWYISLETRHMYSCSKTGTRTPIHRGGNRWEASRYRKRFLHISAEYRRKTPIEVRRQKERKLIEEIR